MRHGLGDLGPGRMLGVHPDSETSRLLPGHQHVSRITVRNTGSYAFC